MIRHIVLAVVLAAPIGALAADGSRQTIDLRVPNAMEQLQRSNPAHYEKIRLIIADLREEPQRAEGDWLQVKYDAGNTLLRDIVKTSYPPKQVLHFSLDRVHYVMYVTRSDMMAKIVPAVAPGR